VTKADLAKHIWDVIVAAYHQEGRTKVEVPTEDVLHVLASIFANVLSQVPDASSREYYLRMFTPQIDAMVRKIRERPNFYIPSKIPLVLPN